MRLKALATGTLTFIPGWSRLYESLKSTKGTDSARYCYTVWLRHLALARAHGLCGATPRRVAELGPGASIGIGLAALLCGAESYTGLDILPFTDLQRNLTIFQELVALFRARTPAPGPDEFPQVHPQIDSYDLPADVAPRLEDERIELIRRSIVAPNVPGSVIRYMAPWDRADVIERGSVDMIFSQAVLEHVDDLPGAYGAMRSWLAPDGFISHQIDFRSHGTSREWNGHWAQSDLVWRLARGSRTYFINREPHSAHVAHITAAGFKLVCDRRVERASEIDRARLARRFVAFTDQDLTTCGTFIQAQAAGQREDPRRSRLI